MNIVCKHSIIKIKIIIHIFCVIDEKWVSASMTFDKVINMQVYWVIVLLNLSEKDTNDRSVT